MFFLFLRTYGELAEWSNAVVLKTIVQQCTGGSNPSLSAIFNQTSLIGVFLFQVFYASYKIKKSSFKYS